MKQKIIITLVFMLLDIISGFSASIYRKKFKSSVMRQGLFHKFGEILALMLSIVVEYAMKYMELGFSIHLLNVVSIYLIVMEIGSILENIAKLNEELNIDVLNKLFKRGNE